MLKEVYIKHLLSDIKYDRTVDRTSWLENITYEYFNDREIALETVKVYPVALMFSSNKIQNDKKFVMEAVKNNADAFTPLKL